MTARKNLKDSLRELQEIVEWFENLDEIDIEKGMEKVKRGAKLIRESRTRLGELQNEFKEIKKDLEKRD